MNLRHVEEWDSASELQADEGDEMQTGQDIEPPLVVAYQASEAGFPGEGVGSSRRAVPSLRRVRFAGPPSEPGMRVPAHPALHGCR